MGSVKSILMGRDKFFSISSRRSISISSCLACMPLGKMDVSCFRAAEHRQTYQFFVRRRKSAALDTRSAGAYVSSRKTNKSPRPRKPMKLVIHSVHRQPR